MSKVSSTKLFSPLTIGQIGTAKNRIAMAPMTRARATPDGIVGKHHVDYYTQRANAGLIITEGTHFSPQSVGWWCAPMFFTKEHIDAWKPVVESVHKNDGLIVLQLWHTGRTSHSDYFKEIAKQKGVDEVLPVAASAIAIKGDGVFVPYKKEKKPYQVPRSVETNEIPEIIQTYVSAAKTAINEVGFDGVEVHSANGYFLDTFLQSKTNKRTDKYGGSLENRTRLTDELLSALVKEVPAGKIGIRFSPNGAFNDMGSEDNIETFEKAIEVAAKHKIGYIHVMDGLAFGFHKLTEQFTLGRAKNVIEKVQGKNPVTVLMGNCGYTQEAAEEKLNARDGEMISFGRPYISNPDLAIRFQKKLPLAKPADPKYFYVPNADDPTVGYTDYPPAEKESTRL